MSTSKASSSPRLAEKADTIHRKYALPLGFKITALIALIRIFTVKFEDGLMRSYLVSDDSGSDSSANASNGTERSAIPVARRNNFSAALNGITWSTPPQNNIERPHLWLDTITYAEGIAGWKTSLLELLYFVQKMNGGATLVEPCMISGRLQSCGREKLEVPVSEIFDLDKYMMKPPPSDGNGSQYPLLVSYADYQRILGNTTAATTPGKATVCMLNHKSRLSISGRCTEETSRITRMKQNNIQRMMDKSNQEHFILHMENYWRGSVYELGWQLGMYIPNDEQERFVKGMEIPKKGVFEGKTIPFHPKHVQFVNDLLQRANIETDNFSAIHWRAEKKGMDFMRCARAVNEAKHIMLRKMMTLANTTMEEEASSHHKFVLMSSLNENEDMMWSGSRNSIANGNTSQRALHYLLHENGFISISGLLEMHAKKSAYNDPGMLAIYDLIIATKANNFATCARDGKAGCNKVSRNLCDSCNHVGKFGRLATSLRKERHVDGRHRGSSYECWPSE